jgi:hypothetical protein
MKNQKDKYMASRIAMSFDTPDTGAVEDIKTMVASIPKAALPSHRKRIYILGLSVVCGAGMGVWRLVPSSGPRVLRAESLAKDDGAKPFVGDPAAIFGVEEAVEAGVW